MRGRLAAPPRRTHARTHPHEASQGAAVGAAWGCGGEVGPTPPAPPPPAPQPGPHTRHPRPQKYVTEGGGGAPGRWQPPGPRTQPPSGSGDAAQPPLLTEGYRIGKMTKRAGDSTRMVSTGISPRNSFSCTEGTTRCRAVRVCAAQAARGVGGAAGAARTSHPHAAVFESAREGATPAEGSVREHQHAAPCTLNSDTSDATVSSEDVLIRRPVLAGVAKGAGLAHSMGWGEDIWGEGGKNELCLPCCAAHHAGDFAEGSGFEFPPTGAHAPHPLPHRTPLHTELLRSGLPPPPRSDETTNKADGADGTVPQANATGGGPVQCKRPVAHHVH